MDADERGLHHAVGPRMDATERESALSWRDMIKNYTDLTGRVAVVIGRTSGLGRTIAIGLAEAGATVVPSGRRQPMVDEVCKAVGAVGRETLSHTVNVSSRNSIDAL